MIDHTFKPIHMPQKSFITLKYSTLLCKCTSHYLKHSNACFTLIHLELYYISLFFSYIHNMISLNAFCQQTKYVEYGMSTEDAGNKKWQADKQKSYIWSNFD
jgi:hypothetical protein